jgi:hypothetical protein
MHSLDRVGRTARAGKAGRSVAMITQYDVEAYQRLEALLGQKLPQVLTLVLVLYVWYCTCSGTGISTVCLLLVLVCLLLVLILVLVLVHTPRTGTVYVRLLSPVHISS